MADPEILMPVTDPAVTRELEALAARHRNASGVGMQVLTYLGGSAESLMSKLPAPVRDGLEGATARAHRAHHPQRHPAQAGLQRDGVARLHAQLALRGGVERDAVGRKQAEAVDARHVGGQARHQQRGERAGHQGVQAQYAQGHWGRLGG